MAHALGVEAHDADADVAIGTAAGAGHGGRLAERIAGEQRGAARNERGLEEFFAGPVVHSAEGFAGLDEIKTKSARGGANNYYKTTPAPVTRVNPAHGYFSAPRTARVPRHPSARRPRLRAPCKTPP